MRLAPLLLLAATAYAGDDPLKLERSIPLEGVKGRIDHLVLAPDGNRLVVAALGNNTVEIVDLKEGRVVHRIKDIGMPTAGAFVADGLVIAAADDGKLHFFDNRTYERLRSVEVGADADPVRADGSRLYVGVGEGVIVAVDRGAKTFEIPLAAHPEGFQLETKGPRIFVNVPDAQQVAVLDRDKRAVVATWKLDVRDNYPMALDEKSGRVLVGCRTPPKLLALDMRDGSVKASLDISGDVDDLFLDPATRRLYASCGEGFLDVIDADKCERVARVVTSKGARTCLLDTKEGRLFVAAPMQEKKPAEILVFRTAPQPPRD
ncbi:MAG: YncE family protein [Planctomycetota bacterium]